MHTHNVFYCGLTIVVLVMLLLLAAFLPGTAAPTAYPAAANADWKGGIRDHTDKFTTKIQPKPCFSARSTNNNSYANCTP